MPKKSERNHQKAMSKDESERQGDSEGDEKKGEGETKEGLERHFLLCIPVDMRVRGVMETVKYQLEITLTREQTLRDGLPDWLASKFADLSSVDADVANISYWCDGIELNLSQRARDLDANVGSKDNNILVKVDVESEHSSPLVDLVSEENRGYVTATLDRWHITHCKMYSIAECDGISDSAAAGAGADIATEAAADGGGGREGQPASVDEDDRFLLRSSLVEDGDLAKAWETAVATFLSASKGDVLSNRRARTCKALALLQASGAPYSKLQWTTQVLGRIFDDVLVDLDITTLRDMEIEIFEDDAPKENMRLNSKSGDLYRRPNARAWILRPDLVICSRDRKVIVGIGEDVVAESTVGHKEFSRLLIACASAVQANVFANPDCTAADGACVVGFLSAQNEVQVVQVIADLKDGKIEQFLWTAVTHVTLNPYRAMPFALLETMVRKVGKAAVAAGGLSTRRESPLVVPSPPMRGDRDLASIAYSDQSLSDYYDSDRDSSTLEWHKESLLRCVKRLQPTAAVQPLRFTERTAVFTLTEGAVDTASGSPHTGSDPRQTVIVKTQRAARDGCVARELRALKALQDCSCVPQLVWWEASDDLLHIAVEQLQPFPRALALFTGSRSAEPRPSESFNLKLELDAAIGLFECVAQIHKAGIAHLDIKPHHVLRRVCAGCEDELVLIDYDCASGDVWGLSPFRAVGTQGYQAPEARNLWRDADLMAVDIWAAGVTAAELVCGRRLGAMKTSKECMHPDLVVMEEEDRIEGRNLRSPRAVRARVLEAVEACATIALPLFREMLAEDPCSRPRAEQVCERLRELQDGMTDASSQSPSTTASDDETDDNNDYT